MSATTSTTLVVSDVHEDLDKLLAIEKEYFPKAQRIVMLGDHFDTFKERRAREAAEWIRSHLDDERIEWLLGNHDCSYFFAHPDMRCSGYHPMTQVVVDEVLNRSNRRKFKLCTRVGKFLLSHAGFTKGNLAIADDQQEALDAANAGKFHSAFNIGSARGGWAATGGCTWLDWTYEFNPLEQAQIVGHTKDKAVRTRVHDASGSISYCLDTALKHVMLIHDEREVEIVTL